MKKSISVLLVTSLLACTSPALPDDPPPPDDATAAMACFVVVIGGIIAVGLWKICKCIPDPGDIPHPQVPPPTNPPPVINPTNAPPTNVPPNKHWWQKFTLNVPTQLPQRSIASWGYQDQSGHTYESLVSYAIQSSTNLVNWQTECTVTGWLSSGAAFWAYYSNGVPLVTTYSDSYSQTNYVPWNLGTGDEPSKSFRLISTP